MFRIRFIYIGFFITLILAGCQPAAVVNEASMQKSVVMIDAGKTGEPISKYIYGQFIEHLGRCIYGGIWAEMLEDRKFYFPITAVYNPYRPIPGLPEDSPFAVIGASPWQIIGPAESVTMVKQDSFVGEHTPLIQSGSGIQQLDLGLVKDKQYVGYIYLKPQKQHTTVRISLRWGDKAEEQTSTNFVVAAFVYDKYIFDFTAGADTENGKFEIKVVEGPCFVGTVSLMPTDNVKGMRADTLELLKELNAPIYRWPGGNFVSGYNWRDGIGDRDRRPPRKNPAWAGVEHNDFGTDEFIALCCEIGAEPMIAVNTGFGDAYSAAQWVEYCNASAETIGGSWRAKNGHVDPYGVKYWCVGNEMFGTWQLGFMQLQHYVLKHNEVAEAMWKVDPNAVLVGVGDLDGINKDNDPEQAKRGITWSYGMLEACADHMTMLSEHFYSGRVPWTEEGRVDPITHVSLLKNSIRQKAEGHRKLQASLPNLKGRVIPIAMDEWNFWHRDYVYGDLGCVYELIDGLGVAAGLHEYYRQSDLIKMAHYAQTVNVIGAIKTTKTAAAFETTGLVLKLYGNNYGTIPIEVTSDADPLDIAAAWTEDRKTLTIGAVNPTEQAQQITMELKGAQLVGTGKLWLIAHSDPMAHNEPGKKPNVVIKEKPITGITNTLNVPPLSVSLYRLATKD